MTLAERIARLGHAADLAHVATEGSTRLAVVAVVNINAAYTTDDATFDATYEAIASRTEAVTEWRLSPLQ
jgi:hypothetical protein